MDDIKKLLDVDPSLAVELADKHTPKNINELMTLGCVYIDAGKEISNENSIKKGQAYMEEVLKVDPRQYTASYNLANSYQYLAYQQYSDAGVIRWLKESHSLRLKARSLLYKVSYNHAATPEIRSCALVNIGNLHKDSMRNFEAYSFYLNALKVYPRNGVASYGALQLLINEKRYYKTSPPDLDEEIRGFAYTTLCNKSKVLELAGIDAFYKMKETILLNEGITPSKRHYKKTKNKFHSFLIDHDLVLTDFLISNHSTDDDLHFSITNSSKDEQPEMFTMFNIIKSDFFLARQLFYSSRFDSFVDNNRYTSTSANDVYGLNTSALQTAQRIAIDILDKIAVATLTYLKIKNAQKTDFIKAWFERPEAKQSLEDSAELRPEIMELIQKGNHYLLALTEIARDMIASQGYLKEHKRNRNATTHRFLVLQNEKAKHKTTKSKSIEYSTLSDYIEETLFSIKLAKNSIVYLVRMINHMENCNNNNSALVLPINLPTYKPTN